MFKSKEVAHWKPSNFNNISEIFQMDQEPLTPAEDLEEDFMKTPSPDKSDPPRYRRASDSRGSQGRSSVSSRHSGQAVTSSSEEDRNQERIQVRQHRSQ